MTEPRIEVLPIENGATPDLSNINRHTQRGQKLVENSLRRRGAFRSIASAGKGVEVPVTYAGNLTLETAVAAGFKEIVNVHVRGDQLVNVVRDDVEPGSAEAIALGLEDNESGKQSYNPDIDLLAQMAAGNDALLAKLREQDKTFSQMLDNMGVKDEPQDAEPQIDRAAELLEKWQVKMGDLWQIGEHRLLCGDSVEQGNVEIVLDGCKPAMSFIDPPYNALKSWDKDEAKGETRLDPSKWFENDNMEWDEYWDFIAEAFAQLRGHSVYVCCDYRIYDGLKPLLEAVGYDLKHCIVWKKNIWGLGKRYRFQHEFIIYACQKDAPFYGGHDKSDVWEVDAVRGTNVDHNTPKPIGIPATAIECSSVSGEVVYDGFAGSGTTLVACQNLGRKCRAIEISPAYCAVILERMATAFPELEIERI